MGARGRKPQDTCVNGHDLTDPENVFIVTRKKQMKGGDKTYTERQCRPCRNKRARECWRANGQRYNSNRKVA